VGADVPFFVGGRNAFVEGIGERLTPLELPPQRYALVKPPAGLATQAVFTHPLLTRDSEPVILAGFLADIAADPGFLDGYGRNDLQPAAQAICPEVAQAASWLQQRFGNSRMTGSGSAVFARAGTDEPPMATWAPEELPAHWVGRMCRSLAEHPLRGWAG
jgi:4-diphosphocytidyl-2-C-methyl-D-erythritol kinase